LIWRADGIGEVLAALDCGFGSLVILPVHSDAGASAIRILVRAIKGGKAPTRILAALILRDERGPSARARNILAGEDDLPLAEL
jgi:tRNA1(Val) A37 N6-methylase TrmN6